MNTSGDADVLTVYVISTKALNHNVYLFCECISKKHYAFDEPFQGAYSKKTERVHIKVFKYSNVSCKMIFNGNCCEMFDISCLVIQEEEMKLLKINVV